MDLAAQTSGALSQGHLSFALALAVAGGFLTALSPCVYPLIPITISVFGAGDPKTRGKNFTLALSYTAGMVLLYAGIGTVFASAGKVFGTLLANHWVSLGFAAFCAAMAASMLGAFEVALPSSLQTKLSMVGGQGYRGAFIMGLASGLVAAPCTGPVLSVLLAFVAQAQSPLLGFSLMLAFALGLGFPFLLLATFSQLLSRLPKSGGWMDTVKGVLAAAMIALALYYFQFTKALPPIPFGMALGLGLAGALLLFAFKKSTTRIAGALLAGLGLFWLLGIRVAEPTPLKWRQDIAAALNEAKTNHAPAMIDFFATWCAACVELDEKTYSQVPVQGALGRFTTIKIDGTEETDAITALYKQYDIKGLPTVVFIDSNGQTLKTPRITGFVPPSEFLPLAEAVR